MAHTIVAVNATGAINRFLDAHPTFDLLTYSDLGLTLIAIGLLCLLAAVAVLFVDQLSTPPAVTMHPEILVESEADRVRRLRACLEASTPTSRTVVMFPNKRASS